ncbi:MAG: 2-oxo acid dehydrogenase subunit E2 [Phycisphaerales bacterium]|nr:2-oxo acid dehydrogenase subunit E2 [Planctomycetota bacterium]MCH8507410.1 2-oxo acid dehydrogenase subunit E2 [Phycisphaerales bacterium]
MPIPITMPRLSDTMEQGTVVKWHVKVGDKVSSGDTLADIETDKATMELQSFDDGTVASLAAEEGQQVGVGESILILAAEGESVEEAAKSGGAAASGSESKKESKPAKSEGGSDAPGPESADTGTAVAEPPASDASRNGSATGDRVFASPLARKIAEEHNLDLGALTGSGPSGRIVRKDVESAIASGGTASPTKASPAPAPMVPAAGSVLEDKTVALNNMRGTIAKRLVESKSTIPHYQVTVSARLDSLLALREQLNDQLQSQGVKLSVNDFLVRACGLAMHQHPFVNSSWVEKGPAIKLHGQVNVGVAVALPEERGGGLVVATIRHADQIGLRQISAETKRLAKKAREKGLSIEEMSDSTFTISNLGMFGVDHFTAIINPPNAAILAVGRSIEKPFVEYDEDGEPTLVIGHEMAMTMSSDHRIIDGAMAAQYLNSVKELLENPAALLV